MDKPSEDFFGNLKLVFLLVGVGHKLVLLLVGMGHEVGNTLNCLSLLFSLRCPL